MCAGGRRVDLPTYPFQRDRYWLRRTSGGAGAMGEAGLRAAGHELLGAAVTVADGRGVVLTGRLAPSVQPWLTEHQVGGAVLLPGTAFVDMAIRAGDEVNCARIEELALQTPLVIPERGAARDQVVVGEADETGFRAFSVYSREDTASDVPGEETWTCHATGSLAPGGGSSAADVLTTWPPEGAEEAELGDFYPRLAEFGTVYGPLFQGLRAAWRRGEEIFAEVALPEGTATSGFGLHPALLDAAIHPVALRVSDPTAADERAWLPFSFNGVELHASGATALRVRMEPLSGGVDTMALTVADGAGRLVATIDSLVLRPMAADGPRQASNDSYALFKVDWVPVSERESEPASRTATVLTAAGLAALADGEIPELAICPVSPDVDVRGAIDQALGVVKAWLADERLDGARLAFVTREDVPSHASVWGLIRSAQSENPGRFLLVDSDEEAPAAERIAAALATGETQLRLRGDEVLAPRLARVSTTGVLEPPATGPWGLAVRGASGSMDDLELVPLPESAGRPLAPGEVRLSIRAAGLNFRDVLTALGMVPAHNVTALGGEAAGVVLEVGPDVKDLAPGDRVFGIVPEAGSTVATTDHRVVVPVPKGWSFEEAASVPVVFLTAWLGLVELADVRPGETVLVHAGAGGVGMAAVQLARHLGAEVFATASPGKWEVLRGLGLDDAHIASSRSLEFRDAFLAATGGRGVDVVLNSLAREFVDASLDLMPRGGRFLEMGKTDIREAGAVTAAHPGVTYRAFDLMDSPLDQMGQWLLKTVDLLESGALNRLPVRAWDVRQARDAFRFVSQAKHVGKVVLRIPRGWDPSGTVLITGGTGTLGRLVAHHLVTRHGIRHPLIVSRRGMKAEGAERLVADLTALGAEPTIVACDVSDRDEVAAMLAAVPSDRPLSAVVHTAGVVDDGVIGSLTDEQIERVIRSKVDSAAYLDESTAGLDLSHFVLYSSVSGLLGGAGQANYAAANVMLDAIATRRRERGLPAVSMAWGLWEAASGMTADLGESDRARVARAGLRPMASDAALELFDAALASDEPVVAPVQLDFGAVRALAASNGVPHMLRNLVRGPARRTAGEATTAADAAKLRDRLAGASAQERMTILTRLVREQAALVLGHTDLAQVGADQPFRDSGFDSLTAVELRNRLTAATGVRLAATTVFDYPKPADLAEFLLGAMVPEEDEGRNDTDPFEERLRSALAQTPVSAFRDAGVLGILSRLVGLGDEAGERDEERGSAASLATMDAADLVSRALNKG
ncbi:SDR family NAD(P)-dependent oxidoreductase [Streptomyces sp. SBT349]|uniref:SDR family NAD(P)-dependent oxidoreductase n=1 Tax=Streptomyces sp. SBT349 TaxID=1580539 RepID=UPI00131E8E8E|nr:SDR family NAD(P)-dependent oxidoreductase [Streptomyces sp. SBT349]